MRISPLLRLGVVIAAAVPLSGCATAWLMSEVTGVNWSTSSYDEVTPGAETEHEVEVRTRYVPPQPSPVAQASVEESGPAAETGSPRGQIDSATGEVGPTTPSIDPPAQTLPPVVDSPEPMSPPVVNAPSPPPSADVTPAPQSPVVVAPTPPPIVVIPPMPPPVVVAPPEASAPIPDGTLALQCSLKERPIVEHVRSHSFRYDGAWKPLAAFMFVSEAAISAVTLLNLRSAKDGSNDRALMIGVGAGFGLDAIGTAILFFHPHEEHIAEYDRPGTWAPIGGCPDDLRFRVGHTEVPVAEDGTIPAPIDRAALLSMATPGGSFGLRWGGDALTVEPSARDRCEWAKTRGLDPRAFCSPPPKPFDAPLLEWRSPAAEPLLLRQNPHDPSHHEGTK